MVSKGFVTDEDRLMFLNPIQWFLQLKHQSTGQSKDRYEWLLPVLYFENTQTVLNQIVTASPDVLVLSVYAWNREALNEIADNYKKHRPDSIVIVGGPDIDAHKNKKFFEKHPYVDYAIYGDGEVFEPVVPRFTEATLVHTEVYQISGDRCVRLS